MTLPNLSRRQLVGAALGTGLATAIGVTATVAQDGTPTPEVGASTTPETGQPPAPTFNPNATDLTDAVQRVTDLIAVVQKDRDAVSGKTDLTTVDALLTEAGKLKDAAAAATGDQTKAVRQLLGAATTARAAEALIRAQLSDYGLPSQQARASKVLAAAHTRIQDLTQNVDTSRDADAATALTNAQNLYAAAYDAYNAGTYAQATRTAAVAVAVGRVAEILTATAPIGFGGMNGRGGKGMHIGRGGMTEPGRRRIVVGRGNDGAMTTEADGDFTIMFGDDGADGLFEFGPLAIPPTESPVTVPTPDFQND